MTTNPTDRIRREHFHDHNSNGTCQVCVLLAENARLTDENERLRAEVRRVHCHDPCCVDFNGTVIDCEWCDGDSYVPFMDREDPV